jgi:hypothetical protein
LIDHFFVLEKALPQDRNLLLKPNPQVFLKFLDFLLKSGVRVYSDTEQNIKVYYREILR